MTEEVYTQQLIMKQKIRSMLFDIPYERDDCYDLVRPLLVDPVETIDIPYEEVKPLALPEGKQTVNPYS